MINSGIGLRIYPRIQPLHEGRLPLFSFNAARVQCSLHKEILPEPL